MLNAAKRACRKVTGRSGSGSSKKSPIASGSNSNNEPITHVSESSPNLQDVNIDYEQLHQDFGIEDNEIGIEDEIPPTPTSGNVGSIGVGVASATRGRRPPVAKTSKSNRRKRSPVWQFFDEIEDSDRVKCRLCNETFKHLTGGNLGGTGTLIRHMQNYHPIEWGNNGDGSATTLNPTTAGLLKYDKMRDREELAKMIALGCLPFSFASSSYLVTYIQRIYNPMFKGIPRSTCRSDIFRLHSQYQTYIRYLFSHLPSRVCLTSDIGHAVNGNDYLTITCHWIDDNTCMQKRIIAFKYDEDQSHTATFISSTIVEVVEFYNLNQKVLCMSFDNASNNNAAVSILKLNLHPPLDDIFHVRCACHVYNLIVKSGLDLFSTEITLVRRAVGVIQGNNRQSRIRDWCSFKTQIFHFYLIGAVLNPSIKMSDCQQLMNALYNYMEIGPTESPNLYESMNQLNEHLQYLYTYYATQCDNARASTAANPTMQCSTSNVVGDDDEGFDSFNIFSTFSNTQSSSRNIDELQFYLQKQKEPRSKEFSPLGWWQENSKQFPVLYAMARDVLNVPISTVASESAFSQARQQLGDTRHSLGSNALEVLVCLRDWIRSERRNQGKEDLDSPEDEELGDILTHGNPSEFNTPEEGPEVHINMEELAIAMQAI